MTLSLTQIGRIVIAILLLLAAGLFVASNDRLSAGAASLLGGGGVNRVDDARRTMVYRLDSERGTVFTFTGERQQVRLLSSVGIAADAPTDTEGWIYGFRIAFLSGTGNTLGEYDIYSQAMLPEMMEEGGPLRFLRTSDERISTPDETFIEAPAGTARTSIVARMRACPVSTSVCTNDSRSPMRARWSHSCGVVPESSDSSRADRHFRPTRSARTRCGQLPARAGARSVRAALPEKPTISW